MTFCFDCTHAEIDGGDSGSYLEPPTPTVAECSKNEEQTEEMAVGDADCNTCPYFRPIIIGVCTQCGDTMNLPVTMLPYQEEIFPNEMGYFCTKRCIDKFNKEIADAIYDEGLYPNGE